MPVRKKTFIIAGIPLEVQYENIKSVLPSFNKFKNSRQRHIRPIWRLESLGLNQIGHLRRQSGLSSYLNGFVEISLKKKKVRHFYCRGDMPSANWGDLDSQLVTFAYSQTLALNQGILVHAAAVSKGGRAYLFFAPSGGGKSTVAQLSKKYLVLGDDVIAIRKKGKDFYAYATPWKQGKFIKAKANLKAKIKAVFFLKKSKQLNFAPLKAEESLIRVLSQHIHFFLYTKRPLVKKIFFTAANFFKTVPAYEMYFRKNENFWPRLEKVIK